MITINELMNDYETRLNMIIDSLKGHKIVFDFDGTMTEFHYAEKNLLPCRDDEIYEYSKTQNIYANARMLKTVKYIIERLNPADVFVLTRTEMTLIEKKNQKIYDEFPSIRPENIHHVQDANNKLAILRNLHNTHKVPVIFVEDTFKTILNAEEAMPGKVYGIHISSLIP